MTGRGSMETVMAATEGGAFEYLAKPFEMAQMIDTIRRAERSLDGTREDDDEAAAIDDLPETEMIGSSPRMIEIYKTLSRVAPTDATVLIEGETGTGKELIARMIHRNSKRAQQPFVPVDCGAIAPSLLESELFGTLQGRLHRRGSRPHGRVRGGALTARVSGRDRRYRLGISAQAAAFLAGARDPAAGLVAGEEGGRARDRGHEPRCAEDGGRGQVPRGPVVSPERGAADGAAAVRAARATFRCWCIIS